MKIGKILETKKTKENEMEIFWMIAGYLLISLFIVGIEVKWGPISKLWDILVCPPDKKILIVESSTAIKIFFFVNLAYRSYRTYCCWRDQSVNKTSLGVNEIGPKILSVLFQWFYFKGRSVSALLLFINKIL